MYKLSYFRFGELQVRFSADSYVCCCNNNNNNNTRSPIAYLTYMSRHALVLECHKYRSLKSLNLVSKTEREPRIKITSSRTAVIRSYIFLNGRCTSWNISRSVASFRCRPSTEISTALHASQFYGGDSMLKTLDVSCSPLYCVLCEMWHGNVLGHVCLSGKICCIATEK